MILAALGMTDNDRCRPGIFQHLGGDVARVSAAWLGVTILATQRECTLGHYRRPGDQACRRADQDIAMGRGAGQPPFQGLKLP